MDCVPSHGYLSYSACLHWIHLILPLCLILSYIFNECPFSWRTRILEFMRINPSQHGKVIIQSFFKRLKSSVLRCSLDPPQQTKIMQIIYHGQINSTNFTTKKPAWFQLVSPSLYNTSLALTFVPPSTSSLQCFVCLEYLAANISLFPISKTHKQTTQV